MEVYNSVKGVFKPSSSWRKAVDSQVITGIFLSKGNEKSLNATLPTEVLNSLNIVEIDESADLPVIGTLDFDEKSVTVVFLDINLPTRFETTISNLSTSKKGDGHPFLKGLANIKEGIRSPLSIFLPYANSIEVISLDRGFVTAIVNFRKDNKDYPFVSNAIVSGCAIPSVPISTARQLCKEPRKDDVHGIFKVEFKKPSDSELGGYKEVHITIGPVIIISNLTENDWKHWQDNLESFKTRLNYIESTTFNLPLDLKVYNSKLKHPVLALNKTLFKKIAKDSTFSFVAEATYEDRAIYWMKETYTGIEVGVLRTEFLLHGVYGFKAQANVSVKMSLRRADSISEQSSNDEVKPFVNWKNAWHITRLPINFEKDANVRQQKTSATTLFNWSKAYADTDFEEEQIKNHVQDADTSLWLRLNTSAQVLPVVMVNSAVINSLYPIKANTDCTVDIRIHFLEKSDRSVIDEHPQWLSAVSVNFDHKELHQIRELVIEPLIIKLIKTSLSKEGNTKYKLILEHQHKLPIPVAPYEVMESWLPVLGEKDWTGYRCVATVSRRNNKLIVKRIERLEVNV